MVSGGDSPASDEERETFADALASLKQRGSSILIVGRVPETAYDSVSREMLGSPDAVPPRRRLLVVPDDDRDGVVDRIRSSGPLSPDFARVVTCGDSARSTLSAGSTGGFQTPPANGVDIETRRTDGSLTDLGQQVSQTIASFEGVAGGLDPAELRIAFDCLPALVENTPDEAVFRFLHLLTSRVRSVGGMAHFWFPQPRTAERVRLFEPLFDAVVELQMNGSVALRWHFRDFDIVSDWFTLGG